MKWRSLTYLGVAILISILPKAQATAVLWTRAAAPLSPTWNLERFFSENREPELPGSLLRFSEGRVGLNLPEAVWGKGQWSLRASPRLSLPTQADIPEWDDDWVLSVRNTVEARYAPSPKFSLTAGLRSTFHGYRKGGYVTRTGWRASRMLDHRVRLAAEVLLWEGRLSLYLPLIVKQVRHADFREDARFNGRWRHSIWFHPEITYTFPNRNFVSLAYETDTLCSSDLKTFHWGEGFSGGDITLSIGISL